MYNLAEKKLHSILCMSSILLDRNNRSGIVLEKMPIWLSYSSSSLPLVAVDMAALLKDVNRTKNAINNGYKS